MGKAMDKRNDLALIRIGVRNRMNRGIAMYARIVVMKVEGYGWAEDEAMNAELKSAQCQLLLKLRELHVLLGDTFILN